MIIKVLGPGCTNCKNLERATKEALAQMDVDATIEKVEDYALIMGYGVMSTPALVIDEGRRHRPSTQAQRDPRTHHGQHRLARTNRTAAPPTGCWPWLLAAGLGPPPNRPQWHHVVRLRQLAERSGNSTRVIGRGVHVDTAR